eukprot:CAMPEP_0194086162 /NCGR_PEP_ID=MMETSP0149-20130528/20244_1 /TAXON_ID=122233 /ORGANISM="Chaetoceros debilis, Strain MM31A-1" /LENGTH=388 /DNA_ID=CAMNT_0038769197 /DNA_START=64 /DNA_END=1230 /DNA_ORIENTATION=+
MSTQSSNLLIESCQVETSNFTCGRHTQNRRVSLSNSQLTRAVDEAFTVRQDRIPSGENATATSVPLNPLHNSDRMHLRKRKCNVDSSSSPSGGNYTTATKININTDFLSGIFQDLADANHEETDSDFLNFMSTSSVPNPISQVESQTHLISIGPDDESLRPNKKARISTVRSSSSFSTKSRSESFANSLQVTGQTADPASFLNLPDQHHNHHSNTNTNTISNTSTPEQTCNTATAAIVDQVFSDSITNIQFPTLPATVSSSSCSSNILTQTSVHAAQVLETPKSSVSTNTGGFLFNLDGNKQKDSYGWFVDMDEERVHDRLEEVAAASESCRAKTTVSGDDELPGLTFSSKTTHTTGETKEDTDMHLDSEVQWAKAADTVDDVLGAFF